jgi:hypothetical protein
VPQGKKTRDPYSEDVEVEEGCGMNEPQAFAEEWIASWNAHDLDRILSHYASDVAFLSPLAKTRTGNGRVVGIDALRTYWESGLATQPNLRFVLTNVLVGHDCLTILYRNHRDQAVAETLEFGDDGRVVRAFACYG